MHIAPQADIGDGEFDVIVLGDMPLGTMIWNSRRVYRGTHLDMDEVKVTRGKRVIAHPADENQDVLLDVDGEMLGRLPATFENLPGALSLRIPGP